jgi:hypothetical protein
MDITPLVPQGSQVIHGYGPGMFRIADVVHSGSVLVLPDRTLAWDVASVEALTAADFGKILAAEHSCDVLFRLPDLQRALGRGAPGRGGADRALSGRWRTARTVPNWSGNRMPTAI